MVIWLVGLSGVGKTTIATAMQHQWRKQAATPVFVDGDEIRRLCGADQQAADYSLDARRRNAERMIAVCAWLDQQGIDVICAILCLFDDLMLANRRRFSRYFQVTLDASMETLQARDPKGLYARARRGEGGPLVGVDLAFTPPSQSDLVLCTDGTADAGVLAARILSATGVAP